MAFEMDKCEALSGPLLTVGEALKAEDRGDDTLRLCSLVSKVA